MSILNDLIAILAPHECLGCGAEGRLLCARCLAAIVPPPQRCYHCHKPSSYHQTCLDCRRHSRLRQVRVASTYEGVAKELLWKLKFAGAQSAAGYMAQSMNRMLQGASRDAIVVPVPTASSRVRQRGYDQAVLIAREVARRSGLPYSPCLARGTQTHQVGSNRQQRLSQLAGAFRVGNLAAVRGAHLILIDDVLTTGATLEAAAAVLQTAGAARIDALVFAQA